jgi:hypothetical protein
MALRSVDVEEGGCGMCGSRVGVMQVVEEEILVDRGLDEALQSSKMDPEGNFNLLHSVSQYNAKYDGCCWK